MEEHVKDVFGFLEEYGATDIRLATGGKHNKVRFKFRDEEKFYVISRRNPGGGSRIWQNMTHDLRRLLGPPIERNNNVRQPRTLGDMMAELNGTTAVATVISPQVIQDVIYVEDEQPMEDPVVLPRYEPEVPLPKETTHTWSIRLAAYRQPGYPSVVYFIFPDAVRDRFPGMMKIERLDDENWKLSRGGSLRFSRYHGRRAKITYTDADVAPFGSIDAEAVEVAGEILVYLALAGRPPVSGLRPSTMQREPEMPEPKPLPKTEPALEITYANKPPSKGLKDELREALIKVRALELTCEYRMTRLEDGRLVWQAPVIE